MGKYYRQYLLCLLYILKHTQPGLSNKDWILFIALLLLSAFSRHLFCFAKIFIHVQSTFQGSLRLYS
jgi:hypothetical protein